MWQANAQGSAALDKAREAREALQRGVGAARRTLAETALRCAVCTAQAERRSGAPRKGSSESEEAAAVAGVGVAGAAVAGAGVAGAAVATLVALDTTLAALKAALAEHAEAASGSEVLREARALRDALAEEGRREKEGAKRGEKRAKETERRLADPTL